MCASHNSVSGSFTSTIVFVLALLLEGGIIFPTSQMGQGVRGTANNISYNSYPGMFEQKEIIATFPQFFTSKLSFEAVREAFIRTFSEKENEICVLLQGFQKLHGFVRTSIMN